jgi:hypothetical protein
VPQGESGLKNTFAKYDFLYVCSWTRSKAIFNYRESDIT